MKPWETAIVPSSGVNLRSVKKTAAHQSLRRYCCVLIALATMSVPLCANAATPTCPAGDHALGSRPPAGTQWRCVDDDGRADGPWLTWYDNGQLMSERHMKHGKEHGRQRSWWPNGQLMMDGVSYDGNRYKGFKYWAIDGTPTNLHIETKTVTKSLDAGAAPASAKK